MVNLLEYLSTRRTNDLQEIAVRVGLYGLESSKQRLVAGILKKLSQPDVLESILAELSETGFALLRFLVIRRNAVSSLSDLHGFTNELGRADLLAGLRELENHGLIGVQPTPASREEGYFIFHELLPNLLKLLKGQLPDPRREVANPTEVFSHPKVWQDDSLTALGYIFRNDLKLTKTGSISKKEQLIVAELLMGTRLLPLFRRVVGIDASWLDRLIGHLIVCRRVENRGERLSVAPGALEAQAESLELADDRSREALIPLFPSWFRPKQTEAFLDLLFESGEGGGWRSLDALTEAFQPGGANRSTTDGAVVSVRECLFLLMTAGVCDLGEDEGDWFWRLRTPEPNLPRDAEGLVHIQPNFEMVAPLRLHYSVRAGLEQVAELTSVDQLLHYRITRDSVYRGMSAGWTVEKLTEWLTEQQGPRRPLPQNIAHSIESWGQTFGRVGIEQSLILVCKSAGDAEQLAHSKELGSYCLGFLAPTILLLRPGCAQEARDAIRRFGLMPLPEVGDGSRWLETE